MADPDAYQPDDQDLKLARLLDKSVDSADSAREPAAPGQDPLLPFLAAYKAAATLKTQTSADAGVWHRIDQAMEGQAGTLQGSADTTMDEQSGANTGLGYDAGPEGQKMIPSAPRPWRHQKPVIRQDEPAPRMAVRWLPLLTRVAALLALVAFMWLLLTRDQVLEPELIALTGSQKQTVALLDGSQVTLRPHSELHRIMESSTSQVYRISGEGFFEVAPMQGREFVVLSDDARVTVTGTRFSVGTWDRRTHVFLDQGAVLMSLPDGSFEIMLSPGETGSIVDGRVATSTQMPAEAQLGWLNDVLVLDKRPLSSIVREIRQHFNVLVVVSSDLAAVELSGTLVLDDPRSILQDLAISSGAELQEPEPGRFLLITASQQ